MSAAPARRPLVERVRRVLPGVWLGVLLALAFIAAPSLFALLERPLAGRVAARLFASEAQLSVALSVVLGLIERQRAARRAASAEGSRISAELLLVLGALFCTVLGHYALQPMLEAARAGQGPWSFGALHGVSTAFYGVKALLVATLTWRAGRS
ncbi:DUF4149 domain-containing protein [Methylibium sp.]|uniref:DUF4149 domain-containing protein n=1 Tax=Methylibium sp. TaxID=2067992 RepID=UPI003D0CA208